MGAEPTLPDMMVTVVRRGHPQLEVEMARNTTRIYLFRPCCMFCIFSKIITSDVKAFGVMSMETFQPH